MRARTGTNNNECTEENHEPEEANDTTRLHGDHSHVRCGRGSREFLLQGPGGLLHPPKRPVGLHTSTANADPWPGSRSGEAALAASPDQLRWHPAIPSHIGLPLRRYPLGHVDRASAPRVAPRLAAAKASMYNIGRARRACPERNGGAFADVMLGLAGDENHE